MSVRLKAVRKVEFKSHIPAVIRYNVIVLIFKPKINRLNNGNYHFESNIYQRKGILFKLSLQALRYYLGTLQIEIILNQVFEERGKPFRADTKMGFYQTSW